MAGHEAVSAVSGNLSDTIRFDNPTQGVGDPGLVSLSDMAQNMLSRIGALQEGFETRVLSTGTTDNPAVSNVDKLAQSNEEGAGRFDSSIQLFAEQIEHSTQVQQQLTRFMMASSVSSSLGRNLNMFLRGQ